MGTDTVFVQSDTTPEEPQRTVVDLVGETRPKAVVLVVGTDDWAIEQASESLDGAGDTALTCHEAGEPCFPCNALLPGRTCPLDAGAQLVLDVRARPLPSPSEGEVGAICALHAGLPLVTSGMATNNPFAHWAAAEVRPDGDVVEACERLAQRGDQGQDNHQEQDETVSRAVRNRR